MLRYDNSASAVRKILRGHRREATVRFMAFRSRWRFAAEFCTLDEGHEKGGVKGEVGYFRRNHLVPVPCAERACPCRPGASAGARTRVPSYTKSTPSPGYSGVPVTPRIGLNPVMSRRIS
jgi:hypothetical protein